MSNNLQLLNYEDFKELNLRNVEDLHETMNKLVVDAVVNQTLEALKSSFKTVTKSYEKIYNSLNLDDTRNMICYYFGRISSLTDVSLDIIERQVKTKVLDNISDNYSLLIPALSAIESRGTISGSELKKELKLKSNSNLSNFIKRINRYELVEVNKIGTSNYYSLSLNGKLLLTNRQKKESQNIPELKIGFEELLTFMNGILEEMEENQPNSLKVIHDHVKFNVNTGEKRLLKQKLDSIFYSRDNYVRTRIKTYSKVNPNFKQLGSYKVYGEESVDDDSIYDCAIV